MIKTIIKVMYFIFTFIVLISISLSAWTSYAFVSEPTKSSEIGKVVQDIYTKQKSVFIDVIDLSKILINNSNKSINNEMNNHVEKNKQLNDNAIEIQEGESSISEDNGDNPLGIVIEQSLPKVNENDLSEIVEEQLEIEQNDLSMNEIIMDMNS